MVLCDVVVWCGVVVAWGWLSGGGGVAVSGLYRQWRLWLDEIQVVSASYRRRIGVISVFHRRRIVVTLALHRRRIGVASVSHQRCLDVALALHWRCAVPSS